MATDHELALYVMTGCPYCLKVKRFLADNGVTIPERNISTDPDAEQTLIAVGGKRQVPCLFIDGKPLYESSDIIAWVQENLLWCNRVVGDVLKWLVVKERPQRLTSRGSGLWAQVAARGRRGRRQRGIRRPFWSYVRVCER